MLVESFSKFVKYVADDAKQKKEKLFVLLMLKVLIYGFALKIV